MLKENEVDIGGLQAGNGGIFPLGVPFVGMGGPGGVVQGGIQDGLVRGGSTLLEPILETRFLLPPDCVGRVMSDVALMRGEVTHTETDADRVLMTALIPVATSVDYAATLASATSGRGSMSVKLHGYRDCPLELGATSARRSVDPLDTSKYILAARSALEGGIFDLE